MKLRSCLFDEPTAGLDPPTAGTICELALKLRDVLGVSSIWVTHRVEDVRFLSSKFVVAAHGDKIEIADEGDKLRLVNTKILSSITAASSSKDRMNCFGIQTIPSFESSCNSTPQGMTILPVQRTSTVTRLEDSECHSPAMRAWHF